MKAISLYLFFFKVINNAVLEIDHNTLKYILPKSILTTHTGSRWTTQKRENCCCNILGATVQLPFRTATPFHLSAGLSHCNYLSSLLPTFRSFSLLFLNFRNSQNRLTQMNWEHKGAKGRAQVAHHPWNVCIPLVGALLLQTHILSGALT